MPSLLDCKWRKKRVIRKIQVVMHAFGCVDLLLHFKIHRSIDDELRVAESFPCPNLVTLPLTLDYAMLLLKAFWND